MNFRQILFVAISITFLLSNATIAEQIPALHIGYAEVDITPELGTHMPGYFSGRRAEGVLDPLLIKTLTFKQNDQTIIISAVDLIGIKKPVIDAMKEAVSNNQGIPKQNIFIHATHTHTGAEVSEVADKLPGQFLSSVEKALINQKTETDVTIGSEEERSVTFIRRYLMTDGSVRTNPGRMNPNIVRPIGDIDPDVNVLSFNDTKNMMVSHGLHCDCVGGNKFSADYPYHLTEAIKEDMGKDWNIVFLNSCSGNINHINVYDKDQRSSNEEARKIGQTLANAAIKAHQEANEIVIDTIDAKAQVVNSPIRKVDPKDYEWARQEMKKDPEKASKRQFNERTASRIIQLAETEETSRAAEIIAIKLGPVGIVGLPAECFVELSFDIKNHSLMEHTWVIGITGGYMQYLPHPRGYQEGGYEATYASAPLSPETPILWCDTAIDLLKEIKKN